MIRAHGHPVLESPAILPGTRLGQPSCCLNKKTRRIARFRRQAPSLSLDQSRAYSESHKASDSFEPVRARLPEA